MPKKTPKAELEKRLFESLQAELKFLIRQRRNAKWWILFIILMGSLGFFIPAWLDTHDDKGKTNLLATLKLADQKNWNSYRPVLGPGQIIGGSDYEAIPVLYMEDSKIDEFERSKLKWVSAQNFVIRNIQTNKQHLLLEKPAYVGAPDFNYWKAFEIVDRKKATYFFYGAADKDTNGDGKIDGSDTAHAFAYNLATEKTVRDDPDGTEVVTIARPGRGPILEMDVLLQAKAGTYERWAFDEHEPTKLFPIGGTETESEFKERSGKKN